MFLGWSEQRHLSRFASRAGHYRILALDHGLSMGPISGIEDLSAILARGIDGGFTGIVITPGMLRWVPPSLPCGIIVQTFGLPACTKPPLPKTLLLSFDEVVRLAPDAIALQVEPFGRRGLVLIPQIASMIQRAATFGIPSLLMINVLFQDQYSVAQMLFALRLGAELGATFVKVPLPQSYTLKDIDRVKEQSSNLPPILLAGGPARSYFSRLMRDSKRMGFAGVCLGRNFFQAAHQDTVAASIVKCYP